MAFHEAARSGRPVAVNEGTSSMNQPNKGNRKIRLGFAGAGMIATVDYGILPNFGPIADKAEIVAIADPEVERARKVAGDFGIPAWFPSVSAMLEGADLDAVVNLTPNSRALRDVHGRSRVRQAPRNRETHRHHPRGSQCPLRFGREVAGLWWSSLPRTCCSAMLHWPKSWFATE